MATSPELPTPITPDPPDLPVEPDEGPTPPPGNPTDPESPFPLQPERSRSHVRLVRVHRDVMRAAAFCWRRHGRMTAMA
ncbi:hypothetical protein SRS16CHR_01909 [Variovorax sp. SRS16]|uniref:hypothetical protein n=1 Tax=Variovorax sp. SRS16 TaxID=282217 RepID=UPI00131789FD|nr:hypothetical protein [Variovorax sp. SRS16]VTU16964.1 hypothetical protein SRS16CHR_01909 [Variovorax sp. SRS16]